LLFIIPFLVYYVNSLSVFLQGIYFIFVHQILLPLPSSCSNNISVFYGSTDRKSQMMTQSSFFNFFERSLLFRCLPAFERIILLRVTQQNSFVKISFPILFWVLLFYRRSLHGETI
jgi:hypothetical protein